MFFKSHLITWRVKIIYCSGLYLLPCHDPGSLIQQQIDLVLLSFLSQLSCPPCSGNRYHHFFGLIVSILSNSTDMELHQLGLFCSNVTISSWCYCLFTFMWLDRSLRDILFTKSTNCSSFYWLIQFQLSTIIIFATIKNCVGNNIQAKW